MAQCVQMEASNRKPSNAQRAATFAQINAANQAQIAANRPRTTNRTGFGNSINCTTFCGDMKKLLAICWMAAFASEASAMEPIADSKALLEDRDQFVLFTAKRCSGLYLLFSDDPEFAPAQSAEWTMNWKATSKVGLLALAEIKGTPKLKKKEVDSFKSDVFEFVDLYRAEAKTSYLSTGTKFSDLIASDFRTCERFLVSFKESVK